MMRRFLSVFVFVLGIMSSGIKAQDVFLSQPEILRDMYNYRDWYNSNTRKYIYSYMYKSKKETNPEKAVNAYEYVRVEREYRVRDDGSRYIRWYLDFNAQRPHAAERGGNYYGILLGDGLGPIKNMTYGVYDHNNGMNIISGQSGTWETAESWKNNSSKWYYYSPTKYSSYPDYYGALYLYQEFYRRILFNPSGYSFGNYEGPQTYMKHQVHNATKQMEELLKRARFTKSGSGTGRGSMIINAGPTQSDAYRYVYQFDTDIIDNTIEEHYYIAFHNIANAPARNGGWAQHIIAFLPPEDGKKETIVYPKPKAKTIYTKVGVLPKPELGITNLTDFNGKKAVWEWTSPPDVSKVHTIEGTAKVTYYIDNEKVVMYVKIPVVVEASETHCLKPATTSGTALKAPFGITTTGRAGETADAWPMLRKGAWMVLESNNQGFVLTRMTTAQINAISQPQEGMFTYDITAKCLKLYDGKKWGCLNTKSCPQN